LGQTPAALHRKLVGPPLEVPRPTRASQAKWQSAPQLPPDIPGRAVARRVVGPVRRKHAPAKLAPESVAPGAVAPSTPSREPRHPARPTGRQALDPEAFPVLANIGRNLTEEAWRGKIDPVIGRDAEIERVLDVLARRRSNNPILVGPPGVGKTAIVEGLALALTRTDSPLADR